MENRVFQENQEAQFDEKCPKELFPLVLSSNTDSFTLNPGNIKIIIDWIGCDAWASHGTTESIIKENLNRGPTRVSFIYPFDDGWADLSKEQRDSIVITIAAIDWTAQKVYALETNLAERTASMTALRKLYRSFPHIDAYLQALNSTTSSFDS